MLRRLDAIAGKNMLLLRVYYNRFCGKIVMDMEEWLYEELLKAYYEARAGKRRTADEQKFELYKYEQLRSLVQEIMERTYRPSAGIAFIVNDPVQREIFAAPYPDRIVQHWVINNIDPYWDHRLIRDSYSCRVGKGTQYGIKRLQHHILSASQNLKVPVYIIKMDITGYFMHISREKMYKRIRWGLDRQFPEGGRRFRILNHAVREIVFDDPVRGVKIQGSIEDWWKLPEDKSLFCQPRGQGMVIGNLTSQVFSNIYLDLLDRFVVMKLGYKHYGRYVDDFYIVVTEEELPQAKRDIKVIGNYLNGLNLTLNKKKTRIIPWYQGVPFLGMVVKGKVIMPGKRVMANFGNTAYRLVGGYGNPDSIVSYLGLLYHYDSNKAIERLFSKVGWEYRW